MTKKAQAKMGIGSKSKTAQEVLKKNNKKSSKKVAKSANKNTKGVNKKEGQKGKNKKAAQKVAFVLFNLGGPDSKNAIKPFLMNFFMDKNIISLPIPFRCFLAWMISSRRSKREAGESYHELGDQSPLLQNSQAQLKALETSLNGQNKKSSRDVKFKGFMCMRYWHPMAPQVVREVRDWKPDRVVLVPLYPQFSTTTTWSSLEQWDKAMHIAGYQVPTSMACCYPKEEGFINASTEHILKCFEQAQKEGRSAQDIRMLFSAHGLPEKVIKAGDPYQWQCEQTAKEIAQRLEERLKKKLDKKSKKLDWRICYQSKVGPMKWIGPSLDEELEAAAKDKKSVVIFPHAFTQEHVETLVELDIEYKEMADELGIEGYYRAKTVSDHPSYIEGLKSMIIEHLNKKGVLGKDSKGKPCCPESFSQCCMRQEKPLVFKKVDKKDKSSKASIVKSDSPSTQNKKQNKETSKTKEENRKAA